MSSVHRKAIEPHISCSEVGSLEGGAQHKQRPSSTALELTELLSSSPPPVSCTCGAEHCTMRLRGAACQLHRDRGLHGGASRLPKNVAFTPNCFKEPSARLAPAHDPLFSSGHCTLQFWGLHAGFIAIVIYMGATPLLPKNFSQQNPLLSLINPPLERGPDLRN
jgi:hypothetical protein